MASIEPERGMNSIKAWAKDDRPREKLLTKGISSLSNAELIAILIGSGTPTVSAVDLAKMILSAAENNLNQLGKFSVSELQKHKGIGEAKSVSIVAAMELGRRRKAAAVIVRKVIRTSEDVYDVMWGAVADLPHEEFWILYLSRSNSIIQKHQIGVGGVSGTSVDIKKIIRIALELNASSLIACHNHPSGSLSPGEEDDRLTGRLKNACQLMDLSLFDHLIITAEGFYSYADEKRL
ncbi:MAG: DNA repair protein RadC [Bacteroidota bacterium]|nr:DNA repair protein RadC [Bacteroidota bacterium]